MKFKLNEDFTKRYSELTPDWGPLGYVTFKRSYARPVLDENRTEEWWETCRRVVEGTYHIQELHCKKNRTHWDEKKAQRSAQEMYSLLFDFKWVPPGRGLWMMGQDFLTERSSAPLFNCSFVSSKDIDKDFSSPFTFLMDMSMLGVGVGFDTRGVGKVKIIRPFKGFATHVIGDSREGWCEIVKVYLEAYIGKGSLPRFVDSSKVRPYGAEIKTFGGVSSGPGPLLVLLEDIEKILTSQIGKLISSTTIVDLFNIIAKCVVSGGLRRSATLALGYPDDEEYLNLKNPETNSERMKDRGWASNNSILATVGMNYNKPVQFTKKNGEIGYVWLDTAQRFDRLCDPELKNPNTNILGTNPCGEIGLLDRELCNVPETFPARHNSLAEYLRTVKYAYLYAKTVTLLPTHNERTNAVQLMNRKIGLSMTGITQNIAKRGAREHFNWCDKSYTYLKIVDGIYSNWFCVPRSNKMTSVKPSGSVSLLAGATPGIHFPYAEYYWRTIRFDRGSKLLAAIRRAGYRVVDIETEGHNTSVAYFPVKEKNYHKGVEDVTLWEKMEIAAQMQYYWADNQVSVTVTFKPEEADQIEDALKLYETRLKSVSFLPLENHGYEHAPYQPMTEEEYHEALVGLTEIDLSSCQESEGDVKVFCDGDTCTLV